MGKPEGLSGSEWRKFKKALRRNAGTDMASRTALDGFFTAFGKQVLKSCEGDTDRAAAIIDATAREIPALANAWLDAKQITLDAANMLRAADKIAPYLQVAKRVEAVLEDGPLLEFQLDGHTPVKIEVADGDNEAAERTLEQLGLKKGDLEDTVIAINRTSPGVLVGPWLIQKHLNLLRSGDCLAQLAAHDDNGVHVAAELICKEQRHVHGLKLELRFIEPKGLIWDEELNQNYAFASGLSVYERRAKSERRGDHVNITPHFRFRRGSLPTLRRTGIVHHKHLGDLLIALAGGDKDRLRQLGWERKTKRMLHSTCRTYFSGELIATKQIEVDGDAFEVQLRCIGVSEKVPPFSKTHYCNAGFGIRTLGKGAKPKERVSKPANRLRTFPEVEGAFEKVGDSNWMMTPAELFVENGSQADARNLGITTNGLHELVTTGSMVTENARGMIDAASARGFIPGNTFANITDRAGKQVARLVILSGPMSEEGFCLGVRLEIAKKTKQKPDPETTSKEEPENFGGYQEFCECDLDGIPVQFHVQDEAKAQWAQTGADDSWLGMFLEDGAIDDGDFRIKAADVPINTENCVLVEGDVVGVAGEIGGPPRFEIVVLGGFDTNVPEPIMHLGIRLKAAEVKPKIDKDSDDIQIEHLWGNFRGIGSCTYQLAPPVGKDWPEGVTFKMLERFLRGKSLSKGYEFEKTCEGEIYECRHGDEAGYVVKIEADGSKRRVAQLMGHFYANYPRVNLRCFEVHACNEIIVAASEVKAAGLWQTRIANLGDRFGRFETDGANRFILNYPDEISCAAGMIAEDLDLAMRHPDTEAWGLDNEWTSWKPENQWKVGEVIGALKVEGETFEVYLAGPGRERLAEFVIVREGHEWVEPSEEPENDVFCYGEYTLTIPRGLSTLLPTYPQFILKTIDLMERGESQKLPEWLRFKIPFLGREGDVIQTLEMTDGSKFNVVLVKGKLDGECECEFQLVPVEAAPVSDAERLQGLPKVDVPYWTQFDHVRMEDGILGWFRDSTRDAANPDGVLVLQVKSSIEPGKDGLAGQMHFRVGYTRNEGYRIGRRHFAELLDKPLRLEDFETTIKRLSEAMQIAEATADSLCPYPGWSRYLGEIQHMAGCARGFWDRPGSCPEGGDCGVRTGALSAYERDAADFLTWLEWLDERDEDYLDEIEGWTLHNVSFWNTLGSVERERVLKDVAAAYEGKDMQRSGISVVPANEWKPGMIVAEIDMQETGLYYPCWDRYQKIMFLQTDGTGTRHLIMMDKKHSADDIPSRRRASDKEA